MPILAVVLGGIVGTGLRIGLDTLIPHTDTGFPWSTLLINVVGSFVLALLVARAWPVAPDWLRAGLGAGLLGSFTTFSAFAVSLVTLTRAGFGWMALIYLVVSVVAGLVAAFLGLRLGARPEPMQADQ
jgi:CrcB protein